MLHQLIVTSKPIITVFALKYLQVNVTPLVGPQVTSISKMLGAEFAFIGLLTRMESEVHHQI